MLDDSTKKFQLGLIYLYALLALVCIGPFVVLRYFHGEPLHALLDLGIVSVAVFIALLSYKRGEVPNLALHFAAGFYTLGAIAVVYLNSPIFVFWIFPSILSNFFLLRPRSAVVVNLVCIALVVPIALRLGKTLDSFGMLSSLFIGSSMAYLFAHRSELQRKRLENVASLDPLTGLANRRVMDEELRACVEDYVRHGIPATLIIFDLDKFKAVNDRFGHKAGDRILVDTANLMQKRLRKTDRAFRFGGEEFVILARNTNLKDAAYVAEQLRQRIAEEIIGPAGHVTASFGCASLVAGETDEHWFVRADNAMYQAKERGRNQVAVADTAITPDAC